MRLVVKFLLFGALILAANAAVARKSVQRVPSRDSEMVIIREYSEEDTIPYVRAYEEVMDSLQKELSSYEGTALIARYFSGYHLTSQELSRMGFQDVQKADKDRKTVSTPSQISFLNYIIKGMKSANDLKGAKDAEKKLAKNKLSKKTLPYISRVYVLTLNIERELKNKMQNLASGKKKQGVVGLMRSQYPDKKIAIRMLTKRDTIVNASWRPARYLKLQRIMDEDEEYMCESLVEEDDAFKKEAKSDVRQLIAGWEWIERESSEVKDESYPERISYEFYASHPEYRVTKPSTWRYPEYIVYDSKGNLVYVPIYDTSKLSMHIEPLQMAIRKYAYGNNDLDIQSASAHTLHYVKVQSGLEKMTAKEKQAAERMTTSLANAFASSIKADMKYGSNSRKAKAQQRKSAAQVVGTLIKGSDFYDNQGYGWLEEIDKRYNSKFPRPYKIERVGPTSFRIIYVDQNGNGLFEVISEFKAGNKPYTYTENYTVNSLKGQSFFTPEEISTYNELLNQSSSTKKR